MSWFNNKEVKAIVSTIGGEESIRILPYIDFDIIKNNPKIFMGYSDTTISHFICQKAWMVSFYWPAIMAWFGENGWLFPYMVDSVKRTLFSHETIWEIKPNIESWTCEFLPREVWNQNIKRKLIPSTWRRWIQWNWIAEGRLIWWCIDVFPFIIGTRIRPTLHEWENKILAIETSEEKMSTNQFERIIRNLWSQWIFHKLKGILLGRAQYDYMSQSQINYDEVLLKVVSQELWLSQLPLVTNMDFGHTDPMFVLPLGCRAKIDCNEQKFLITESSCLQNS
jgi:muramoyltetrapeptide carboxypeptidase LdcA involved in peptidoglycan recycling